MHDPVSFKPFSEHSHIVALATTGNVYLAESLKNMGGRDAIDDSPFQKSDIITLQNPHALMEPPKPPPSAKPKTTVSKSSAGAAATASKSKAPEPYNVSPYSSGLPGASLTSTSIDPHTASTPAMFDEEELMFDAIQNPVKAKKEKDVGKRRAYVRVVTSLGGSLNLELFCEKAPKTCYNFLMLAREGKYNDVIFHRMIPNFMVQTGDPTGTGSGGQSYWGSPFRDEYDLKGAAKHDSRGVLAMANKGKGLGFPKFIKLGLIIYSDTNGSQWYITFRATPHLDGKHTVFGKLVGGEDVLDALEQMAVKPGTDRPLKPVKITEVAIHADPFDDYKRRLAKKLAHQQQSASSSSLAASASLSEAERKKAEAERAGNWFGEVIKPSSSAANGSSGGGGSGVGKYLQLKRPREGGGQDVGSETKKRKVGWGDFSGW
ncbi:Peptidyl-prolyl cis-trans isomerase-like 2 {ECO:0000305} Short=PPIase; {ECO:0000250/UniProtKB:Q08752}; {ECO:0000250/UniProtKB:Q13356}; AltName: Full=Cyclophilin-60; AltName: Full=Cyclophilin-like protein Cyp-60; AltName: Full=Rotamase [Serendipita indica DSM 11827]|uniref:Related to peptidylprolyl isomerase (Cyclophilin)-like n=1 Tax=Serendipita indica (strain DSM 11827) TaxID=1109443 RepID=G4TA21_SERID|nr:Peptidyl-prolyl cis-trans isomerase-like 2 {ECO:0000305} Short=PPIase; {ECO:0000250/UniProtKB:Q08752}; {ECO:0000250/UniProtKB:Q13356}; AltName: Full=Cyclophilin-60; AltName: Full=Cyclophilin-like protein Cyp-60; AltName: Full=Rotamase [Serendipita indica DSM 11827]CCA68171.1 related to peptidylprolyl isomerase (cyclophilin)-like [Serendipita indica DSM 11827]